MATNGSYLTPDWTVSTAWPPIRDELETETSASQDKTVQQCLPLLHAYDSSLGDFHPNDLPKLDRAKHARFLHRSLQTLPAVAVGYDASRPWMVYWALTALSLLGENVTPYRERVTQTFASMQNVEGGFGGGHGQISHCASSYAVVLSLAMVGGSDSLGMIDRKALWHWLGQVKQADGGFRVCVDGEEDVRGGYCSMVMISLLNLPLSLPPEAPARRAGLESFMDGLPEYMSRCQTFEGGISGSPQTEAHGAYAFCALACLSILGPPQRMISSYLDVPLLVAWLSARQYAPEGGFAGRTNKLVDGCYSHWVGGCWPLLDAAISDTQAKQAAENLPGSSLYSRDGLTRYILACCQSEKGGLRDKPSTYPDSYHTCYVLAGLSSAQHYNYYKKNEKDNGLPELGDAFRWASLPYRSSYETGDGSRLRPIHPIYVIPWSAVEDTREYFEQQGQF
ncbi:MAG: hypothetical protein LQ339_002389 [Xanthoria mediterranea]|nr:MAG: hypothetical protein LQ339_002389 [Xanthoria mediterranea]